MTHTMPNFLFLYTDKIEEVSVGLLPQHFSCADKSGAMHYGTYDILFLPLLPWTKKHLQDVFQPLQCTLWYYAGVLGPCDYSKTFRWSCNCGFGCAFDGSTIFIVVRYVLGYVWTLSAMDMFDVIFYGV